MDFKDWRKAPETTSEEPQKPKIGRFRGKQYIDYIDEQIHEAQARGDFDNLPGAGKPLHLDENPFSGDKAMAYSLLKQNGYAPPEVELAKEIRTRFEKAQERLEKLRLQRKSLCSRRIPPFGSEKLLEIYFQNPQFGYYFLVLTSQRLLENLARAEAIIAQNKIAPQTPFAN